jgi:ligand-binding sensor domain-containing protein/signal transduction histidine kinase
MFVRFQLWRGIVGLAFALAIAPVPGRAVDPEQPATSYIRTTFTVEDGLSSNVVNAVLQTRDGFLWIGTDAGLNRFDGRRFTPLYFRGPKSTPQGIVSSLAEGPDGDLWIGTSAGLFRIPKRALDQFDRSLSVLYHPGAGISDEISSLHFSRDGAMFVGTSAGLYRFFDNQFINIIPNGFISRIEESAEGHLLIVSSLGFIELDGTRRLDHPGLAQRLDIHPDGFFHVVQDRKGVLWFSTASGLVRRVNGSFTRIKPYGPGGHGVHRVYEDPQGTIWVTGSTSEQSKGGIFRLSDGKLESLAPGMQVRAISSDREGNLWVGTNGEGLVRFKNRPIRIFTKSDGLPNNVAMTVLSKRDGSLWVGSNCGGLSVFNGKSFKTYAERDGLSNSCVWALAEDKSGDLWVGTWGGGIFRFADGHFEQFDSRQGLADSVVRSIAIAHDGSLWIATENGLSHMVNGKFRNYTTADGLSSNRVVSVYQDRHDDIWVGTSRGINRMTGESFAPVFSSQQIFDPRYISLAEDASGALYALSAPKGIDRIEENQLVEVNHDLDLLTMVTSPNGDLWFTGGNGIFRFSESAFRQHKAGEQLPWDYAWFGKADGMISTQCGIGSPNAALGVDGKLWVATVQGLAVLDLPKLSFDNAKPIVFVEDVTVARVRRPAGHELVLPPGTHHVELRFDSVSLASPEKIRFQYRMDDVDAVWLDADNALTAVYTNVPVGTHAFRIRASNSAGVWDRSGISFPVIQEPYFYETGWFRLLAVAAIVVILTGVYRLRLRQIRAQINARLDERVLERTRVARELHDTLLQSFQGTLLYFQAGISKLLEHPMETPTIGEARRLLQNAMDKAVHAIADGRDAIKGLRLSVIETNDLAVAIRTFGEELTIRDFVAFHVQGEGTSRDLHPIIRDEVYRIAGEAMRNAFRHAEAKEIGVEIHYDHRWLRVLVRDDGKGIDPKLINDYKSAGHFGLRGMTERAELIGGKLTVRNGVGSGTEVELTVPAERAYTSTDHRRRMWLAEKFLAKRSDRGTKKTT